MKKLILCVSLVLLVFTKVSAQSDSSKHVLFFGEQHYLSGNIKILEYIKRQDTSNIDLVMEISPSEAFVIS